MLTKTRLTPLCLMLMFAGFAGAASTAPDDYPDHGNARYLDSFTYIYDRLHDAEHLSYSIEFVEPLLRDDKVAAGAMRHVIQTVYGQSGLRKLEPDLLQLPSGVVIRFLGASANYYFLPVERNADGEILVLSTWAIDR